MARTSRTPKIRLGELLVAAGLVSDEKVRIGLEEQRRNNLFLGEALVQLGFVSEEAIAQAIIQHFNLPFLSASQFTVPPEVFNLFPERMYNEYQFIAVDKIERVIIIIAAGPINQDMMEELERVSECKICHYVSTWRDIFSAIHRNSKELGGEAQIELTGLGSMLLDSSANKTNVSITQKIKKHENAPGLNGAMLGKPALSRSMAPVPKTLNAANLSAMLSPLAVASKSIGVSQVSSSTPPSPRLTAFLKAAPPGNPSNGLSGIFKGSSANLQAVHGPGASSPNISAIMAAPFGGMQGSAQGSAAGAANSTPAGMAAGRREKDAEKEHPPQKRLSSFLTIRKS